jgi:hypothetical protein
MKFKTLRALLIGLAAVFISGCGGGTSDSTDAKSTANIAPIASLVNNTSSSTEAKVFAVRANLKGYPLVNAIWPSNTIKVCWLMGDAQYNGLADARGQVRDAVETTWAANSNIKFVDWEQCPAEAGYQGIRIQASDMQPQFWGLGSETVNHWSGKSMILNFWFGNWSETTCFFDVEKCTRYTAVHEFGHALGFSHEQNRPDTPQWCRDIPVNGQPQGPNGDTLFKNWDPDSIMNYCNPIWTNDGKLSATDVEMVQHFYGKPTNFAYIAKYAYGAQIGSFNLKTGVLRYPYIQGTDGLKSQMKEPLLHKMLPSPDGKSVYIAVKDLKGGSEALRRIDTVANVIVDTAMISDQIIDVQVSPDNKSLYVLYASGAGNRGLRVFSADLKIVEADIAVPNGQLLARPRIDNDSVYVLTAANASAQQGIVKVSTLRRSIIQEFMAGASGKGAFAVDLAPDEKTIYFVSHAVAGDNATRLAKISLSSGQYELLPPFAASANLTELQVLDANRILLANGKAGTGPSVYDLRTASTVAVMEDNDGPLSFPYAFSPDGRTIYAMYNQLYEGNSYFSLCQFGLLVDGTYDGDDLEMIAFEIDQGVLDRPFAIANLD